MRLIDGLLEIVRVGGDDDALADFRRSFNPTLHPRWPKGTPKGGQFMEIGGGGDSGTSKSVSAPERPGLQPRPAPSTIGDVKRIEGFPPPALTKDNLSFVQENGMNDWPTKGPVAQEVLGDYNDTFSKYSVPDQQGPDGQTVFKPERQARHRAILDEFLGDATPVAEPRALFTAGGTAAGKSTALKQNPDLYPGGWREGKKGPEPANAVLVDPDAIKERLPEYQEMVERGEPYAAVAAHEESSELASQLKDEAMRRGLNLIIDGTGNGKPGKFNGKVNEIANGGYGVDVMYMNAPLEAALPAAIGRAMHSGRWVPEPEIKNIHQRVSGEFPTIASNPAVRHLTVFDRDGGKNAPPVKIAEGGNGSINARDPRRLKRFLDKADRFDPVIEEQARPAAAEATRRFYGDDLASKRGESKPDIHGRNEGNDKPGHPHESDPAYDEQYADGKVGETGIPPDQWIIERPFDSADWMDKPGIVYQEHVEGKGGKRSERVDKMLKAARAGQPDNELERILKGST